MKKEEIKEEAGKSPDVEIGRRSDRWEFPRRQ
jgi:hypothetical protein